MNTRILRIVCVLAGLVALTAFAGDLLAQDAAAPQVFSPAPAPKGPPSFMESLISMLPMLAICYLIFWVMVIRPQDAKVKKHDALINSLNRGDSVVTTGGLIGRVASVDEQAVLLEIAPNVKVKIAKAHILGLEKDDSKAKAA